MDIEKLSIREDDQALYFKVKVQPRASRCQIAGLIDDALKIQLTSPPVDGAANAACVNYLSEVLAVAKSRISIVAGEKSRTKTIRVAGIDRAHLVLQLRK